MNSSPWQEKELPVVNIAMYDILDGDMTSIMYGMFALLWCTSIYCIVQGNNFRARHITLMLSLTLFGIFASTTAYTVFNLLMIRQRTKSLFENLRILGFDSLFRTCSCVKTSALTINIIIGDAIVCWRAYVVWQGNRFIMGASIALLLTTFALATMDTTYTCENYLPSLVSIDPKAGGSGNLYEGVSYGVAASVLSLCTNLFATTAVAFKAWKSWRTIRKYIVTGPRVSQSGKILALIVESGAIYCAIWVLVVAYQAGVYIRDPSPYKCNDVSCESRYYRSFWYICDIIVDSSLVPIIAIYPTIVIILVAINRSHMENGFIKAAKSSFGAALPLRPLTVTVDTAVTTHYDIGQRSSETVLAICEEDFALQDGTDGLSTHIEEERKQDILV